MSKPTWVDLFFPSPELVHERQQSTAIHYAQTAADSAMDTLIKMRQENDALRERVERQELVLQTLLRWHIDRGDIDAATLGVLIARADLADGFEDGGLGPDRSMAAPSCTGCGRPVNPKRAQCVFCSAPVTVREEAPRPAARTVSCGSCSQLVPENSTYYGDDGLICEPCYVQTLG